MSEEIMNLLNEVKTMNNEIEAYLDGKEAIDTKDELGEKDK